MHDSVYTGSLKECLVYLVVPKEEQEHKATI